MNGHTMSAEAHSFRRLARPCACQWMPRTNMAGSQRPAQLLDLRRQLDANGNIAAWRTEAFLPMNTPNLFNRPLLGFVAAAFRTDGQSVAADQGNAYPPTISTTSPRPYTG